ncbi:MAG: hypothetical protein QW735_03440 [archaeon]
MQTIFCPKCKHPIKTILRDQIFQGWVFCSNCGEPTFITAKENVPAFAKSLTEILNDCAPVQNLLILFEFLLKRGSAKLDDIIFVAGKSVENAVLTLHDYGVLEKRGEYYSLVPAFENYVNNFISSY